MSDSRVSPVRPLFIDPDRIEERLAVIKNHNVTNVTTSMLDELTSQGRILLLLLWPDRNGKSTMFTVRYKRPVGDPATIDAAVRNGLRRVLPSIVERDGVWSVSSDADRVIINMIERIDLRQT